MPNHITNILCLEGKKQILDKILPESNKFSFVFTVPPPPENPCPRMSLNDPLSNWFVDNWGTKWDALNPIVQTHKKNKIIIMFDTAWSPPDNWLKHIHLMFPQLQFNLVWIDEDFPSCGYICTENNSIKIVQYEHNDPKAREFVKTHFPDFYTKEIEQERLFNILKKISPELTKYFKSIKKTIGNFDKPISDLKIYSSSLNSFRISVNERYSKKSWRNIFSKLTPNGKKLLLNKTKELLKNEGIVCIIRKESLIILKNNLI